jgi:hypothetical protein
MLQVKGGFSDENAKWLKPKVMAAAPPSDSEEEPMSEDEEATAAAPRISKKQQQQASALKKMAVAAATKKQPSAFDARCVVRPARAWGRRRGLGPEVLRLPELPKAALACASCLGGTAFAGWQRSPARQLSRPLFLPLCSMPPARACGKPQPVSWDEDGSEGGDASGDKGYVDDGGDDDLGIMGDEFGGVDVDEGSSSQEEGSGDEEGEDEDEEDDDEVHRHALNGDGAPPSNGGFLGSDSGDEDGDSGLLGSSDDSSEDGEEGSEEEEEEEEDSDEQLAIERHSKLLDKAARRAAADAEAEARAMAAGLDTNIEEVGWGWGVFWRFWGWNQTRWGLLKGAQTAHGMQIAFHRDPCGHRRIACAAISRSFWSPLSDLRSAPSPSPLPA